MISAGAPACAVLVFVDGLGWGGADPQRNPCWLYGGELFRLPAAREGQPPSPGDLPRALPLGGWARPIDAVLGVSGIPQSATGQTTLLAGCNAQGELGHHLTGFPDARLREILMERSILKVLAARGVSAAFINAYRPAFFTLPRQRQLHLSATTVANLGAGLPFFTLDDLRAGNAVYQEFTNAELRSRGFEVPLWTPDEAGHLLARAARRRGFNLFEYFQTDRAGHAQDPVWACRELTRLEAFMRGLLAGCGLADARPSAQTRLLAAPPRSGETAPGRPLPGARRLVVLTSDHGNLEDLSVRGHTRNPVPLLAWGCGARDMVAAVTDLSQVAPALVRWLTG